MQTLIAITLMFTLPPLFLAAVCLYGPLADLVNDRRLARRRAAERAASAHRPIRIAEWTPYGWAEVVPAGGAR